MWSLKEKCCSKPQSPHTEVTMCQAGTKHFLLLTLTPPVWQYFHPHLINEEKEAKKGNFHNVTTHNCWSYNANPGVTWKAHATTMLSGHVLLDHSVSMNLQQSVCEKSYLYIFIFYSFIQSSSNGDCFLLPWLVQKIHHFSTWNTKTCQNEWIPMSNTWLDVHWPVT